MRKTRQAEFKKALNYALAMLRYCDRFEAQIAARMPSEEIAKMVLKTLRDKNLLDDSRVAADLAKRLLERKNWGPRRIREELLSRGATKEAAANALRALPPESEIIKAAIKDAKGLTGLALARRLHRIGFSRDAIVRALDLESIH